MNINLKNYQEKAVGELIATFKTLLTKEEQKKVCVFQAPTGSGKTLMTAKFIEEIIREVPETDLCFVWISIGKGELHLQSKHSLERVFGGAPRVSLVEEEFTGGRERIIRNEVVVVNWEKLRSKERETGDWKNILMKDGEKLNFRDVLSKTREQRKVIMIIDESHIGATAERTNELRDEINADVILEMSATPRITPDPRDLARGTAGYVFVEPKDVIDEGMIKKELIINEKIDEITDDEADSQEVVLQTAYKKRLELKKLFEKENANINPLVLVQIPTAEAGEEPTVVGEALHQVRLAVEHVHGVVRRHRDREHRRLDPRQGRVVGRDRRTRRGVGGEAPRLACGDWRERGRPGPEQSPATHHRRTDWSTARHRPGDRHGGRVASC